MFILIFFYGCQYFIELRLPPLFKLWRQNAIPQPIPDDEVPDFFSSFDESDLSPEV